MSCLMLPRLKKEGVGIVFCLQEDKVCLLPNVLFPSLKTGHTRVTTGSKER